MSNYETQSYEKLASDRRNKLFDWYCIDGLNQKLTEVIYKNTQFTGEITKESMDELGIELLEFRGCNDYIVYQLIANGKLISPQIQIKMDVAWHPFCYITRYLDG
jgi:myo-inositol-hexaphosphate 3-phosphohydrolase